MKERQNPLHRVYEGSSEAGLYFNMSKTKVIKIIRSPVVNEQDHVITNGQEIENKKNFVYLEDYIYL